MATFEVIPRYTFPGKPVEAGTGIVPRETLAQQSSVQRIQLPVCALNAPLRFGYGLNRVGAMLLRVVPYQQSLLLPYIIMRGPIDGVEAVEFESQEAPATIAQNIYTGGTDNVVNPLLSAAWAARGFVYADVLPGIANGVLMIPAGSEVITNLTIRARCLRVYDPRDGTQTFGVPTTYKYSRNPVLALADFITSAAYGKGETMDWASVTTCANIADEMPSGSPTKRRSFGLMFDRAQDVDSIEETLRAYAGVWVIREGGTVRLVADAPAAAVYAFVPANYVARSLRITPRGRKDTPTVVTIKWTDTSVSPWKEATTTYPPNGPAAGVQWREEVVSMPGIQDAGFATRECIRRLNEYALCDLSVGLTGGPQGVVLRRGDVVTLTDDGGFAAKPFRLLGHAPNGLGGWAESLVEYDAGCYSNELGQVPETPDTDLPLPSAPPALLGLTATEETYQADTGIFASRVRIAWTDPGWPFVREYRVAVRLGATEVHTGTAGPYSPRYVTPALQEGQTYTVEVAIVSKVGAIGAAVTTQLTLAGKAIPPGDVKALAGFEAGGRVFLSWSAADNPTNPGTPDPDVWRYQIRRGLTSGSFATAAVVEQIDALSRVIEGSPTGTWRFYVVAIDSIGQLSATPKTIDLTVTLDASSFLLGSKVFDEIGAPSLTNMTAYTQRADPLTYYVSDFSDGIGYGHADTNNATGTFADLAATVFSSPHTAGSSTYLTQAWDLGTVVSGNWSFLATYTDLVGTATASIETSVDGTNWTAWVGTTAKCTARFMRGRITTTGTMVVRSGAYGRADATPRTETFPSVLTQASGGKLVQLANAYAAVKTLQLTPLGATFAIAVADRVLVSAETGLMLAFDLSGSGSVFQLFNNSVGLARLIVAGDYLEFDVRAFPTNPLLSATFGIYATYTDASNSGHYSTASAGAWTAIKTALTVGKTMNGVNFAGSSSVAGAYACQIRNVRITDGAGTTRATLWASGEPPQNSTTSSTAASNVRMGPANSFLAYAFNASNAQIAREISVSFEGV